MWRSVSTPCTVAQTYSDPMPLSSDPTDGRMVRSITWRVLSLTSHSMVVDVSAQDVSKQSRVNEHLTNSSSRTIRPRRSFLCDCETFPGFPIYYSGTWKRVPRARRGETDSWNDAGSYRWNMGPGWVVNSGTLKPDNFHLFIKLQGPSFKVLEFV
jgi:hypothetical protein